MAPSLGQISFSPDLPAFYESRRSASLTVLAGANNSGKSLALKWLKRNIGRNAYMVGSNRFYHVHAIQTAIRDPTELDQWENQFNQQFLNEQFNHEQNYIDLSRVITGLSDKSRKKLFELCGELLQTPIELKKVDEDNELSNRFVEVGDQNLSVASTGARLLLTLLGICMDDRFNVLLIDEPELGLSPGVQERLSELFRDAERRREVFPHMSHVFLSTHSHLMLDRQTVTNNFIVSKEGTIISLTQVESINDYHRLQFNLLGNSFDSLFLPAAIVIVEGKSDYAYLDRVLQLRFPERRLTVLESQGDVKQRIYGLKQAFGGDLQRSPFQSRIFVVLDSVHQLGLSDELHRLGVLPDNIVTWSKNGIEYVYPDGIVRDLFAGAPFTIEADRVTGGGLTHTKADLSALVVGKLTVDTPLPEEIEASLLTRITAAID